MPSDVQFALRQLGKSPGFTATAILTLALGISACTALFSICDRLVLRPLDLPEADRLVRLWTNNQERNVVAAILSVPKYEMYRDTAQSFSSIAAATFASHVLTREGAEPEQLNSISVTASFVPTLGLQLARGRNFTAQEDAANGPPVCLLGYDIWKTRFGQRDSLVGETITLNGVPTTVIGILPEHLPAPLAGVQLLAPWPFAPPGIQPQAVQNGAGFLQVTARLKPGVTFAQADAEVHTIARRYAQAFPGRVDANAENELRTFVEELVGPVRPTFYLLLVAVGFVLLIACANVSNLFLSRLSTRHKEVAVRLSLGATRGALVRQFLIETAAFCLVAAGLGTLLALWSLDLLQRLLVNQLPAGTTFTLDGRTLAITTGLAVLSALLIGFVPALQASRPNLAEVLKDSARGAPGGVRGVRFRGALIVIEVALSVALLIGSGLLLVSFVRLQSTPPGFNPHGSASAFVNLPAQRYQTKAQQADFYYQVLERLRGYPQVKNAAVALSLPVVGFSPRAVYTVEGQPVPPVSERPIAVLNFVSETYFSLLQIPLRSGRLFAATDLEKSPGVCVINESFARRLFPHESALGHALMRGLNANIRLEIVGVVADVKASGLNSPPPDIMYVPLRQWGGAGLSLVAQLAAPKPGEGGTDADPVTLQSLMRSAVAAVDKSQAIAAFATLDNGLQQSLGLQRVTAWLTGVFAGVALLLSALGLYSVLAYAVAQRTGEIGIRMALGAGRGQVVQLILSEGLKLVVLGLLAGLGVAAAGSRAINSLLFDIQPLDPLVFGGVTVLFLVAAACACVLPSLRASRVDPLVALRAE